MLKVIYKRLITYKKEKHLNIILRFKVSKMAKQSKEERVLDLFMNEPTKHWHFSDVVKTSGVSENIAGKWLRRFQKNKIIKRVKTEGKMPYFQGNWEQDNYRNRKKMYALQKLYETGLIPKLQSLKKAKTIIIFGSFVRSDWITNSDVDVFIYGDSGDMPTDTMWQGLGFQGKSRIVQVHAFNTRKEMEDVRSGLLKNVLRGYVVKGDLYEVIEAVS